MTREPVRNLTESEYPPIDYETWRRRALAVLVARYPDRREDWRPISRHQENGHNKPLDNAHGV